MSSRVCVVLVVALLVMGAVAAAPAEETRVRLTVSETATVELVAAPGVVPQVDGDPSVGAGDRPSAQTFALYRSGDGAIVQVGMGLSHTAGQDVVVEVDRDADPSDRYVLHVVGDGEVVVDGAVAASASTAVVFPFSGMAWDYPMTEPNAFEGGHTTTLTPPDALRDEGVALLVYTRTRRQPVNVSNGFICLDGKGADCATTEVRHDEVAVSPLHDETLVVATSSALSATPDEDGQLSAVINHGRPAAYAVDDWFSVVIVPAAVG